MPDFTLSVFVPSHVIGLELCIAFDPALVVVVNSSVDFVGSAVSGSFSLGDAGTLTTGLSIGSFDTAVCWPLGDLDLSAIGEPPSADAQNITVRLSVSARDVPAVVDGVVLSVVSRVAFAGLGRFGTTGAPLVVASARSAIVREPALLLNLTASTAAPLLSAGTAVCSAKTLPTASSWSTCCSSHLCLCPAAAVRTTMRCS